MTEPRQLTAEEIDGLKTDIAHSFDHAAFVRAQELFNRLAYIRGDDVCEGCGHLRKQHDVGCCVKTSGEYPWCPTSVTDATVFDFVGSEVDCHKKPMEILLPSPAP